MKKLCLTLVAALFLLSGCDKSFDQTLLYGTWCSGTLYEKYTASGNGYTWDEADDVSEAEAQGFTWTLEGDQLTQNHRMESSTAIVPKTYTVNTLTETTLEYQSNGRTYRFTKQ